MIRAWRTLPFLALGAGLACTGGQGATGVRLRIMEQDATSRPTELDLRWLNGTATVFSRRVPETGALDGSKAMDVTVLIEVPVAAENVRGVVVRGLKGMAVVGQAAALVTVTPGMWQDVTLVLGSAPLLDANGDGIPDLAQPCGGQPGGCGARDGGVEPDTGGPDTGGPDTGGPDTGTGDAGPAEDAGPTTDLASDGDQGDAPGAPADTEGDAPEVDAQPDVGAEVGPADAAPDAAVDAPPPVMSRGTGLRGEYFDNGDFTASRFTRIDPKIDFDWGTGSPDPRIGADSFSIRWTGFIEPRYSETYTFTAFKDDGAHLWIDGILVFGVPGSAPADAVGTIPLVAGKRHAVRLDFVEQTRQAFIRLSWSSASQSREIVPASQLYPP